jgi:SPP1 family predicted phage head-tail adaptor
MNVDLNRRCRIEYKSVTQDPNYGTEITTWTLKGVYWCNVQDVLPSRSEAIKNGLAVGAKQSRLRLRYRKDLNSAMRVIIDGVTWQFISDFAELGKKEFLEVMIEKYTS